jgi:hypothetical protein
MKAKDIAKLKDLVLKANSILDEHGYHSFRALPWKFAKVKEYIENGYPHTLEDTIIISDELLNRSEAEVVKTLIHEKVHIFQRLYPQKVRELLKDWNMKHYNNVPEEVFARMRANPDLDPFIYVHTPSSFAMVQLYNTPTPKALRDSQAVMSSIENSTNSIPATNKAIGLPDALPCQLEHPYEIMACLIAELLTNPTIAEEQKKNDYVRYTTAWLGRNFR